MKINSKQKGSRAERAWVKILKEHGFEARRSQQFCGAVKDGEADVICEPLKDFHFEVKHVEKLNVIEAMNQAIRDSGTTGTCQIAVVVHKKNGTPFLTTMLATDFLKLVQSKSFKNSVETLSISS